MNIAPTVFGTPYKIVQRGTLVYDHTSGRFTQIFDNTCTFANGTLYLTVTGLETLKAKIDAFRDAAPNTPLLTPTQQAD